jgi:hypothetical protein
LFRQMRKCGLRERDRQVLVPIPMLSSQGKEAVQNTYEDGRLYSSEKTEGDGDLESEDCFVSGRGVLVKFG